MVEISTASAKIVVLVRRVEILALFGSIFRASVDSLFRSPSVKVGALVIGRNRPN
jgi:hypothetical protein